MGRSEVFAAMLGNHELMESTNDTATIKDINPDPLNEMLRFIYTDQVNRFILTFIENYFLKNKINTFFDILELHLQLKNGLF
jgi:hypothetical protein